jgi:hypothetical protein
MTRINKCRKDYEKWNTLVVVVIGTMDASVL